MKFNNKIKFAGIALMTALVFGAMGSVVAGRSSVKTDATYSPSTTYTTGDSATYYSSISSTASGDTLLSALRTLNLSRRKSTVGYSNMGTSTSSSAYIYTDYDPSTAKTNSSGQKYGTSILSFYSGTSTTSWNREHVWPNSRGGGSGGSAGSPYPDADIFMPRPTITSENSNRGNSKYVQGLSSSSSGWDPVTAFGESGCYNGTSIRGECARIIFYCMTVNSNLVLDDTATGGTTGVTMGKLSDLLQWNLDNPVNSRELNRNEGGEYLQGNRNAFVDHPEYACKIWGDYNSTTKSICASASTSTKTLSSITVTATDSSNYYVSEGRYITLKATATYSDSTTADITDAVTWSSGNTSYATVTNGKVTGVSGSSSGQYVNITATYGSVSGTHGVYVWTTGDYGTETSSGSGDSGDSGSTSSGDWTLVTSSSQLVTGNEYVIAENSKGYTAGSLSGTYMTTVSSTFSSDYSTITSLGSDSLIFTLGGSSGAYTLTNNGSALGASAAKSLALGSGTTTWAITPSSSGTTITSTNSSYGSIQYNASSPRFLNYTSSQTAVQLYTRSASSSGDTTTDSVSLDKSTLSVNTGSTAKLTATASGTVTWSSSNTSVATVSGGTVTGVKAGTAVITATCGTATATCTVTVTDPTVSVTGVTLSPTTLNLTTGGSSTLTATVSPSNATNTAVTWSSSNTSVATVSSGKVTAVAAGTATITVKTSDGSYTATCAVTVTDPASETVSVTGVTLDKSTASVDVGSTTTLTATVSPSNASDTSVSWSSSDTSVATVSNGVVTGVKAGAATITVTTTDGSYTASCTVTVNSADSGTVTESGTYQITFSTSTTDGNSDLDSDGVIGLMSSGSEYVSSASSISKAYAGKSGLKLGSSKAVGTVTLNLNSAKVTASLTSIILHTAQYSSDTGTITLSVNGSSVKSGITPSAGTTTVALSSATVVTSITIATSAKRAYISGIDLCYETVSSSITAESYASTFLSTITCTGAGAISFSTSDWSSMATAFAALATTEQTTLKSASANSAGTTVEQCVARYDAILAKYGTTAYEDFMSRGTSSSPKAVSMIDSNSTMSGIISVIVIVSISAIGIVMVKKIRKEDK